MSSSSTTATTQPVERKVRVEPAPAVITLAGKVAIVTGGSRGIGAAVSTRLARDGAKVIVNFNSSPKEAAEVVDVIRAAGGTAEAVQADTGTVKGVDHLFAEAKRLYGRVDIVIANAGAWLTGLLKDLTETDFDKTYSTNVKGVAFLLKNAANVVGEGGRIITIGSTAHRGSENMAAYSGTKAAIGAISSSLALELGPKNITVNTIHPGPTATDMISGMSTSYANSLIESTPMKRFGLPGDIGDAVALLASESARWITGQQIVVSGGLKD